MRATRAGAGAMFDNSLAGPPGTEACEGKGRSGLKDEVLSLTPGHEAPQGRECPPHVGVDERRLRRDEKHVHQQRGPREPEQEDGDVGQAAREDHVDQVQP